MLRSLIEKCGKFDFRRRLFRRDRIVNAAEFDQVVELGVLDCYEPAQPFISKQTRVVTIGSCFAQNVAKHLSAAGYDVFSLPVTDRLFTPIALQTFIETAIRDAQPVATLRHHWSLDQGEIDTMRRFICEGAVVILTFGLSAVWFDKISNEPILDPSVKFEKPGTGMIRTLPDSQRFEMRQMPIDEITASIFNIINALRALNHDTKIVLTLSPIPLVYSGSDYPVVVADCLSKAGIRFALDEVGRAKFKDVYYFPSFELLRWLAPMVDKIWYEDELLSHIRHDWIAYTVGKFRQHYCTEAGPPPTAPTFSS